MKKKFIEKILRLLKLNHDSMFYKKAAAFRRAWYDSILLNVHREKINFIRIKLKFLFKIPEKKQVKLHLGCGNQYFKGYTNIDKRKTSATDLVMSIIKLPYPDNSIKIIETYHVIEHLPRNEFPGALKEWRRVLTYGGKLVIECPDFDEIVRCYLKGDIKQLDGIFGLQRFKGDFHFFGYNNERLQNLLRNSGFIKIKKKDALDYHIKEQPCIRLECVKK